jgi:thiosulfate dehydrogenase
MVVGVLLIVIGIFVGIAVAQDIDTGPYPDTPEIHGGLLYDRWWAHLGVRVPEGDHPLWATQTTNTRTGPDTWRCKECHGWDYLGKDGAYGSGSHFTGFPGVYEARTKSTDEIVAALKGEVNPDHDFSPYMSDEALNQLAAFIQGLSDYREYVDYSAKAPIGGDPANGKALFDAEQGCQWCHGLDGAKINFGDLEEPEFVGTVAVDNPQEFMHKVIYGQPDSDPRMIAAIEREWEVDQVVDILAYAQTLPTTFGAPPPEAPATPPAVGMTFKAVLSPAQEVAELGGEVTVTGSEITVAFYEDFSAAEVELKVTPSAAVSGAHFHCNRAGSNGPVVFGLISPGVLAFEEDVARGTLTNADFTGEDCVELIGRPVNNIAALAFAMQDGLIYVNVHTENNPSGEVRGQLVVAPALADEIE